jgi:hypothetical protein
VPTLSESSHGQELARSAVRRFADEVAREIGEATPEIVADVKVEGPAEELFKALRDADILVVGPAVAACSQSF